MGDEASSSELPAISSLRCSLNEPRGKKASKEEGEEENESGKVEAM